MSSEEHSHWKADLCSLITFTTFEGSSRGENAFHKIQIQMHVVNPLQTFRAWVEIFYIHAHGNFFTSMLLFTILPAGGSVSLFFFVPSSRSPASDAKPTKNSLIQIYAQNAPHLLDSWCYSFIPKTFWGLGASSRLLMIIQKGLIIGLAGVKSFFPPFLLPCHSTGPPYISFHNQVVGENP